MKSHPLPFWWFGLQQRSCHCVSVWSSVASVASETHGQGARFFGWFWDTGTVLSAKYVQTILQQKQDVGMICQTFGYYVLVENARFMMIVGIHSWYLMVSRAPATPHISGCWAPDRWTVTPSYHASRIRLYIDVHRFATENAQYYQYIYINMIIWYY